VPSLSKQCVLIVLLRRRLAAANRRVPRRAIRPPIECDAEPVERLANAASAGHVRAASRPRRRHPRGQHLTRQSVEVHAYDVPKPARLPPRDVDVDRLQAEPLPELLRSRDVVIPRVTEKLAGLGKDRKRWETPLVAAPGRSYRGYRARLRLKGRCVPRRDDTSCVSLVQKLPRDASLYLV